MISEWPSRDPIGESGGINLYAYVGNNPVNFWDLLGLKWELSGGRTPDVNTLETSGDSNLLRPHLSNKTNDPSTMQEIRDGIILHEKSHIEDALKQCPNLGVGVPAGEMIRNPDPVENAESEVKAYQKEIDYLNSLKNSNDPQIQGRINNQLIPNRNAYQRQIDIMPPSPK